MIALMTFEHVAAGQVMGLQPPGGHAGLLFRADARLHGHDLAVHDDLRVDPAETHADQAQQGHVGPGEIGLDPDFSVAPADQGQNDAEDDQDDQRRTPTTGNRPGEVLASSGEQESKGIHGKLLVKTTAKGRVAWRRHYVQCERLILTIVA